MFTASKWEQWLMKTVIPWIAHVLKLLQSDVSKSMFANCGYKAKYKFTVCSYRPNLMQISSAAPLLDPVVIQIHIIGASLSEPHTSVTALRTRVSVYPSIYPWTDHLPEILNKRV